MSIEVPIVAYDLATHSGWIERIILELADAFNIRVVWDGDTALLSGVFALAGGLVGGLAGGRLGVALGAGIGGATGLGVSTVISLRELWAQVKEKLKEVMYIVLNFLRRLDPLDYINAVEILLSCYNSKRELVTNILSFVAHKLGREVLSSLTES